MSIYPVKISKWHEGYEKETSDMIFQSMVDDKENICDDCGKAVLYGGVYMFHAVPYGYGDFRVWCEKCIGVDE